MKTGEFRSTALALSNGQAWDIEELDATGARKITLAGGSGPTAGTGTVTAVADSATNVTLKAANASRRGLTIVNTSTALLRVKCGATASSTSFTVILNTNQYWECPFGYTGIVDGIWDTDPGTGSAVITEFT